MKDYRYRVVFVTGKEIIVWASCDAYAKILGQADQIRAGNAIEVMCVVRLSK